MTPAEKEIMRTYLLKNVRSQVLSLADGTVCELERYGIIHPSAKIRRGEYIDYNIQPWAWKYLKKRPNLMT
ncbi:superinfection exclusion B family protein [bacterium]|nr:superinfection exclusion B family protein [bacterium]